MVEERSRKDKIEQKTRHLKIRLKEELLNPNRLIAIAVVIVIAVFAIGSITSLGRNWSLQQEVLEKQSELAYLKLQVESTELENEYYSSTEYQELAARRQQNKKLAGETMIVLPENSEEAKNKYAEPTEEEQKILTTRTNFDQWLLFLFGI